MSEQALVRDHSREGGADEARYLKLMQGHRRLRAAMIKLGSQRNSRGFTRKNADLNKEQGLD